MHLTPNQTYPWVIHLSAVELSIIQGVLRGDDLTEEQESLADHISRTLDKIRPLAERTLERRRAMRRPMRQHEEVEQSR